MRVYVLNVEDIEEKLRRKLTIARLPNVDRLNGSCISSEERESANRAFVRHYADAESKPSRLVNDLCAN